MKTRLLSVLLVILLVLMTAPAVLAQGIEDMTCAGLSEADCAILLEATAKSAEIESFYMDFALDFALSNLAAIGMMLGETDDIGDITVVVDGAGAFVTDMAVMPPARMEMTLNAAMNSGTESENESISLVVADGIIYMSEDGGATWEGMTYESTLDSLDPDTRAMVEGLAGGDLTELPEEALSPQDLAENPLALLEEFGLSEADIISLAGIPGFYTQQRVADQEMFGQTMVIFETVVDFGPLFASPEFNKVLTGVMSAASEGDDEMASQMNMLVPMLLSGLDVQLTQTQYIGAEDMFVHGLAMDMSLAFDLTMLMGGAPEGQQIPPLMLDAQFEITLDQINNAFEIVAPEGATMVKPDSM